MILIFCEAEEGGGAEAEDETGLCDDSLLTFVDLFTSAAVEPQSWQPGSGSVSGMHAIISLDQITVAANYSNDKNTSVRPPQIFILIVL